MIQRIQTIYLFFAALFILLYYMFPIAVFTTDAYVFEFFNCHISHPENLQPPVTMVPLAILPLFSLLLSLISIFLFKRRKLQMRLGKINMLMVFTTLVVSVFYFFKINDLLAGTVNYGFSTLFPMLAFAMIFMANKSIRKDENLIRSADRIR